MFHPLDVVVPLNISIGLNVPFPSDMRTMIKIHDHDISRRHPPASTQPVGTSIGDHQGVLYVHPFVPVAIPSPNSSSAREGQVPPIPIPAPDMSLTILRAADDTCCLLQRPTDQMPSFRNAPRSLRRRRSLSRSGYGNYAFLLCLSAALCSLLSAVL